MKRWTRILTLFCLAALCCATLAAAEFQGVAPLNCHEMTALTFGQSDDVKLLGNDGAEAALSAYFDAREAAYRGDMRLMSADDTPDMSAAVAGNNALRAERVREMESRLDIAVLDADVTARIDRDRTARNPDGTWTLYVYEWTYYDYDDLSDGEGGLDVSGFGTWHILTAAERPDGAFAILSDEYDESDILGIDTLSEQSRRELEERAALESIADETPVKASASGETAALLSYSYYPEYDVEKAVAYSETYWENYNPAYANFNPYGGDCANFTSQSISAGGMPQVVGSAYGNDGWYYTTSTNRSATWTGTTNLRSWMTDNRGRLVANVSTATKKEIFAGSPVFYSTNDGESFRHAVLCVGVNSAGNPIINSHNTDRYHELWNYFIVREKDEEGNIVKLPVRIDTVQLTSASFGSFSGYVKTLDADFHAYIINLSLDRYVSHDGNGKVTPRAKTEQAEQVWRFLRQDDGSYEILSAKRDALRTPALATVGGSGESRTDVCAENYTASASQQWYLYQSGADGNKTLYQLRPKCSDRVLDIFEERTDEDTKLWIFTKNGAGTQLFQIEPTQWVTLDDPVLQVDLEGTETANVRLFWEPVENAATYRLVIKRDGAQVRSFSNLRDTSSSLRLDPGSYEATVEAVSANGRNSSISAPLPFVVPTSFTVTYSPNGGENAPETQLKLENEELILSDKIPTFVGYEFSSWNTEADGRGDDYFPGAVYAKEESLRLYAQWTPCEYVVTFDPGQGSLGEENPEEITVTYHQPYGELPEPTRAENAFMGWYTEPDEGEGELITADSLVTLTENQTLYAHWESTLASISSVVTRIGNYYIVQTSYQNIPDGSIIVACGYLDGQMVSIDTMSKGDEEAEAEDLTLEGDLDTVQVMALDNTERRAPLCPCNVITRFH